MSDSELSDAPSNEIPPDSVIEATLQKEVKKAAKGPLEDYTVSKIRKAAETALDLPENFFKGDQKWKSKSKAIIEKQVEVESAAQSAPEPKSKAQTSKSAKSDLKKSVKRPSPEANPRPAKKQKIDSEEDTSALSSPPTGSDDDDFEETKKPQKGVKGAKKIQVPTSKAKAKPKTKPEKKAPPKQEDSEQDQDDSNEEANGNGDSDSEMSVVLDDAPAKKERRKSKSADASDKKTQGSKAKPKASTELNPDQEEIKKLQGWLGKCGIRKLWGKELKQFGTSKAKMKYLRDMLADVGMTGRYSNEKAAQIKEARELAADIEAVQEGNERWGKSDEEDGDGDGKTRGGRRLVRGAKNYDFLSSDGEETD